MKKKNPAPTETWQMRAEAKAKENGYADPASMVAKSEKKMHTGDWHIYPWKDGVWVAVDGTVYRGNGGNEREEYCWHQRGPWLLLNKDQADGLDRRARGEAADAKARYERLMSKVVKFAKSAGLEIEEN